MTLLWDYLKQYKKLLAGALLLATVNQFFSLLDPQIFRLLIDNYATKFSEHTQDEFLRGVLLLLGGTISVAMISRIAKNFQDYYVNVITQRLGTQMYAHSVEHSFSLPYAVFEDQRSGEHLQKLQKARTDAQKLITTAVNVIFLSGIGIVFVLIYAFYVHWMIGLMYALIIPIMAVTIIRLTRSIRDAQAVIVREMADLSGSTTETLRNVELVKSLGLENQEITRLNNANEKILGFELKKIKLIRKMSFIQGTLINAIRSGLMLLMLWLIFQGDITLGEFFSLLFYSFFIFNPLSEFGTFGTQLQEAKASMEQLGEALKMKPEEKPRDAVQLEGLKEIEFKNVFFSYSENSKSVILERAERAIGSSSANISRDSIASLQNDGKTVHALNGASLSIKAGETVAFVGPSGSGKTTLVKMIVGLYKPTGGNLTFNGTDVAKVDLEHLRQKVGLVAQETQLFAGTIRENLIFVRPHASDDECLAALRAAAADSLLKRANDGLDTKIGEGGLKLSGGERQRLAIARALLREPELLIFDEATSSLDSITEQAITETIQRVEQDHPDLIRILVAHRLSTIAHADTIYVLEKGSICEHGSHKELLAKKGLYAALWRQQSATGE